MPIASWCKNQMLLVCLQLINILTLSNPNGIGAFFPNGLLGKLNKPTGYSNAANLLADFPTDAVASQVPSWYMNIRKSLK